MRKKYKEQLPLMGHTTDHPHAVEMKLIDKILEKTSIIYEMALQDLTREVKSKETGANGMSAEQVVKAAIIKQSRGFSYEDLAFHIAEGWFRVVATLLSTKYFDIFAKTLQLRDYAFPKTSLGESGPFGAVEYFVDFLHNT